MTIDDVDKSPTYANMKMLGFATGIENFTVLMMILALWPAQQHFGYMI